MADAARKLNTQRAEKEQMIEERYHVKPELLAELEGAYPGITDSAFETAPHSSEQMKRHLKLLNLIKETIERNAKRLPYEVPDIPKQLPMKVAQMIFPNFDFVHYQKSTKKREERMKERLQHLDEEKESYNRFIDEIQAEAEGKKLPPSPKSKDPKEIQTSVREDVLDELDKEAS